MPEETNTRRRFSVTSMALLTAVSESAYFSVVEYVVVDGVEKTVLCRLLKFDTRNEAEAWIKQNGHVEI